MAHLLPPAGVRSSKNEAFMFNSVRASNFFARESSTRIPPNIHDYRWTDYKEINRRCMEQVDAIEAAKMSKDGSVRVPRSQFNPAGRCPDKVKQQWQVPPCACPRSRGAGYRGGKGCACFAGSGGTVEPAYGGGGIPLDHGGQGEGYGGALVGKNGFHQNSVYNGGAVNGNIYNGYSNGGGGYGDGVGVHGSPWAPHRGPARDEWGYCPPVGLDPRCLVRPRNKSIHNSVRPTGEPYFAQESRQSCADQHEPPLLMKGGFTFDDWLHTADQREPPASLRGTCIPHLAQWCAPVSIDCDPLVYSLVPLRNQSCY